MKKTFKSGIAILLTLAVLLSTFIFGGTVVTNALALDVTLGYYDSTKGSDKLSATKNIATQIFTREDLPNGTEIRIAQGFRYRPEGWISLDQTNESRPSQVYGESTVIVDDEWWGDYNYRAFNISEKNESLAMSSYVSNISSIFTITLPEEIKEKTIRILAIGNSFSNDAFHYAEEIAAKFGYKTEFLSLYQSGCYISKHLDNFNNKTAAYTIYRNGVQVRGSVTMNQILKECHYDYITLQQGSARSDKWSYYYTEENPYILDLYNAIKAEQPNAQFLIHQTWGYSPAEAIANGHASSLDHFTAIESCYKKAAELLLLPIAKSGKAVQIAKEQNYLTDDRDGENSIYADEYCHLTDRGDFIAGCVLVETIFGVDTTTKDFTSLFADSKNLTKAAHSAVTGEAIGEEEEPFYYAPKRTMFRYKKSDGWSKCLYKLPNMLEANTEYTITIATKFVTGTLNSSNLIFALYGIDDRLYEGNETNNAMQEASSLLRSSDTSSTQFTSVNNKSNNVYKVYKFTLTEEEAANKNFYLGYSFDRSAGVEFYISEFSLYKSSDETKTSLLNVDDYSTDVEGWVGPYGTATTIGKYVEYDPSYFNYAVHIKYTGTKDTRRIGVLVPSVNNGGVIKKGVKYTISFDYYMLNRGFDYGVYPMLFASSATSLGDPYYDRIYSKNYNSGSTKTLFGDKVGGVYKSRNGFASYSFTIAESETLRNNYFVGFLMPKNTSWTSSPEFYLSNLKLTAEGSDENLLPVDQYQYSFNGANSGEKWRENDGWIKNSGKGYDESNYVPYGTGDGNIDNEVDIRDLVTADETVTAAGFNPFLDTNVDRTIDQKDIDNLKYRLLGLGINAPEKIPIPEEPVEPEEPEIEIAELNVADQEKFTRALKSLRGTKFKSNELIKFLYTVAFSSTKNISTTINADAGTIVSQTLLETVDNTSNLISMTAPGLYGGTSFTDQMAKSLPGTQVDEIKLSDIITGDIICVLENANDLTTGRYYTTDGENLYDLTDTCEMLKDTSVIDNLANNDLFVVLRPSIVMNPVSINNGEIVDGTTDLEKAFIATAESFMLRGDRTQYADIFMVQNEVYRWERGKAPEDYTSDETGYSNCTGFVHDVYYNVLGWDYGDFKLVDSPSTMKAYTYNFTHTETEEDIARIKEEYKSQLRIGDIVFYTRQGGTHAMLYVGNGNIIHCSGSTYSYANNNTETEEPAIRYMTVDDLFDPNNTNRYLFQTATPRIALYIIRPLNMWEGTDITDAAKQRIGNMRGIFAEKTASSTLGQTVNAGDTITYTFTVNNTNSKNVTIDITDTIPENTVLIENGKVSDKTALDWTVELAPDEIKKISYTVKVLEEVADGTAIVCSDNSKVGGIPTKAYPIYVGRTLTQEEQEILSSIVYSKADFNGDSVAFANSIYEDLFGVENILGSSIDELYNGVFKTSGSYKVIATEGKYAKMIAPSLYGGKSVLDSERFGGERTRLLREHNLVAGDILYLHGTTTTSYAMYIYIGDGKLLNLSAGIKQRDIYERLTEAIGWGYFAVLRPSLALENDSQENVVEVSKTASKTTAQTVLPGENVTYTLNLENVTDSEQTVSVIDILPKNTTFISGCENVNGDVLKWDVTIPAGETSELSYDFKVQKDNSLCGSVLNGYTIVNGQIIKCYDLYIERTASSSEDQRYISNAIRALKDSTYRDMSLLNMIYTVAFTNSISSYFPDTPADTLTKITKGTATEQTLKMVAPTLYGGTAVNGVIAGIKGAPCTKVTSNDLIVGDILFVNNSGTVKNYIYDKDGFVDLSDPMSEVDTTAVLNGLTSSNIFAVFRPSINISRDYIIDDELEELTLTEQQKAVIATAESYILRGEKLQYADTKFGGIDNTEYRWNTGNRNPEFVNRNEWGYINCAAFTYEVYNTALGIDINYNGTSMWATSRLQNYSNSEGIMVYNYKRSASADVDQATMDSVKQEVLSTLKPADMLVVRRNDSSGHVMLYIGNGTFIHSTGGIYTIDVGESYEATIRYQRVEDYFFTPGNRGYLFKNTGDLQVTEFLIVRPLIKDKYNVEVPQETVNRMNNMQGIMAQKLSSHNSTTTANLGEEVTFTFEVYNTNDTAKTVEICDTVPANTTYVSGAQNKDGDNLSWSVTIPANTRKSVSYTVTVNQDATIGDYIQTTDTSTVGGVRTTCPKVYINRTLSKEEQQKVIDAYNSIKDTTANRGFALVNEIYKTAGLTDTDVFTDTDYATVMQGAEGTFKVATTISGTDYYQLKDRGYKYRDMMVETLYGGRRYYGFSGDARTDRTRLAREHHIMVGDVIVRQISGGTYYAYLHIGGDYFINITTNIAAETTTAKKRLELLLSSGRYYAVYRPSFNIE
ncbi:MAG: DUF4886 domain-containing protein [Ruminococcaceae bacterium]|nr:DUF4886 domain-containing protein [Oscillospiraceae bacterium]